MQPENGDLAPTPDHVPEKLVHDFDFYRPAGAVDDVQLAWQRLHAEAPDVFWTPRNGGHWVATRGADIQAIQTDHQRFSQRAMVIPASLQQHRVLPANADPPEHGPYRRIIMSAFLPKAVNQATEAIRALAAELTQEVHGRGGCEFIADVARKLPIVTFLRMLDLPLDDREMLLELVDAILHRSDPAAAARAQDELGRYVTAWIERRRDEPGQDLISTIVHAGIDGRPLVSSEIFQLVRLVLFGGLDTVTSLMGFIWRFLAMHPDHCRDLVEHPELRRDAIEELIRRHGIVNTARYVAEDTWLGEAPLRAGDMIQIPNALFGLDERVNPDPLVVDFRRQRIRHVAFGSGPHTCPGAVLARIEIGILLDAWLERIPRFSLAPGTKPQLHSGTTNNGILRLDLAWSEAD